MALPPARATVMSWTPAGSLLSTSGPMAHKQGRVCVCVARLGVPLSRVCGGWGSRGLNVDVFIPMSLKQAGSGRGLGRDSPCLGRGSWGCSQAFLLADHTAGPEQGCGGPASASLGPQPPPSVHTLSGLGVAPSFPARVTGALGHCAGSWGWHRARCQANGASKWEGYAKWAGFA